MIDHRLAINVSTSSTTDQRIRREIVFDIAWGAVALCVGWVYPVCISSSREGGQSDSTPTTRTNARPVQERNEQAPKCGGLVLRHIGGWSGSLIRQRMC